jgi:hypothetical protein
MLDYLVNDSHGLKIGTEYFLSSEKNIKERRRLSIGFFARADILLN